MELIEDKLRAVIEISESDAGILILALSDAYDALAGHCCDDIWGQTSSCRGCDARTNLLKSMGILVDKLEQNLHF